MSGPVVLVHAGAGTFGDDVREHEADCRDALRSALESAAGAIEDGLDAVAAARSAVMVLESFPLFNAGCGSALCADGSVQMSAALMRGSDRAAGAVAGLTRSRHPIAAAAAVLEGPQVLMIGGCADDYAAARGAQQWAPSDFVTERQLARLAARRAGHEPPERGTVGAVCLDGAGMLAAATSTGGILGQAPGRVGDTPLIGAGTWADRYVAVSCTGDGEAFIRAGASRLMAGLVEQEIALASAARTALDEVGQCGGRGGLIALDSGGNVAMPFTTDAMPRGIWRAGESLRVELW